MSQVSTVPPPAADDPFRYGWRFVAGEQVPLTLEDVLHPLEGDVIPENTQQERDRRYFHNVNESLYADDPDKLTLSDCLIDWGHPTIRPHAPDFALLEGVYNKEGKWGTYRLLVDGGRPVLVAEIVSPHTRDNDVVEKLQHYFTLGVPLYLLVDQKEEDGPRELILFRRGRQGFVPVRPRPDGRYLLPGHILVGLEGGRLVCFDATTGNELGDYTRVCQQLEDEIAGRKEAEKEAARAERARKRAEKKATVAQEARQQEEERRHRAEEARQQEEERRQRAEEARQRAEEARQRAEEAHQQAEAQARHEAEARQRAEERARQAEEEKRLLLERLRALEERGRNNG